MLQFRNNVSVKHNYQHVLIHLVLTLSFKLVLTCLVVVISSNEFQLTPSLFES
uniref:Uncharacterized protein n=1 Tax=Solanum lycopersicum TaxID=4081 RepID=A0A3Q7IV59_SOLLC